MTTDPSPCEVAAALIRRLPPPQAVAIDDPRLLTLFEVTARSAADTYAAVNRLAVAVSMPSFDPDDADDERAEQRVLDERMHGHVAAQALVQQYLDATPFANAVAAVLAE